MMLSAPAQATYPLPEVADAAGLSETSSECSQTAASGSSSMCVKVPDFNQVDWKEPLEVSLGYLQIVNFPEAKDWHHSMCAMCGNFHSRACFIPRQNKDICRDCDCAVWMHQETGAVLKFCKGCKNFVQLADFSDKPTAAKCSKCRERGRANYVAKKRVETERLIVSTKSMCARRKDLEEAESSREQDCTSNPAPSTTVAGNPAMSHFSHWQPKVAIDKLPLPMSRPPIAGTSVAEPVLAYAPFGNPIAAPHLHALGSRQAVAAAAAAHTMSLQLRYLTARTTAALSGSTPRIPMHRAQPTPSNVLLSPTCRPSPRTVTADFQFSPFSFQSPPPSRSVSAAFCTPLDDNSSAKKLTRQVNSDLQATEMATEAAAQEAYTENEKHVFTKRPLETQPQPLKKRCVQPDADKPAVDAGEQRKPLQELNTNVTSGNNHNNQLNEHGQQQDHGWVDSNPLMQLANWIDVLSR